MSVAAGLDDVRRRIAESARAVGRAPEDVTLVAVCKKQPIDKVMAAHDLGVTDFGENTAQGLMEKCEAFDKAGRRARWHFIGRLQRNKINAVMRYAAVVQSIDSLSLAAAVSQRAPQDGVDVFVQVNVGLEPQKGGSEPAEVVALAQAITRLPRVRLRGLMTIPPFAGDPSPHFRALAELAARVRATPEGASARELSMGMSDDFETAIRCGATLVRVGTAIFGERVA